MKKIIIISAAAFLFYGFAQTCGCGNSCSKANAQTNNVPFNKYDLKTVKIKITGMTCAGCSNHVTKTLQKVQGVIKVDLEYPGDVATVEYDVDQTNEKELIAAIEKINYKAEIVK